MILSDYILTERNCFRYSQKEWPGSGANLERSRNPAESTIYIYLFWENCERFLAINYFCKNPPL